MQSQYAPFQTRLTHFRWPVEGCLLPFAVGSATQHNPVAAVESQNSQDAAHIIVSPTRIVGVVSDGCSGTHADLEGACRSSNEVGAKLLAVSVANAALKLSLARDRLSDRAFLEKLTDRARNILRMALRALGGRSPRERERFSLDFLTATVLGFVVTERRFLVFHSGDGIIAVNGQLTNLASYAGQYLSNDLVVHAGHEQRGNRTSPNAFKRIAGGRARDLASILLATDGLTQIAIDHESPLIGLTKARPPAEQSDNGLDYLLQEFRQAVAWNPRVNCRLDDDATFVLLRRTDPRL